MAKKPNLSHEISFKKADDELKIVYGEVYVPWDGEGAPPLKDRDTHGHWATRDEIQKAAHSFMENLRLYGIDKQHDEEPDEGVVVECFVARDGDPDFVPGSWVIGTKILKDETWEEIKKGVITGYSLDGDALVIPDEAEEGGE